MALVSMKGQSLGRRFSFALQGVLAAVRLEASFRTQLIAGVLTIAATFWVGPALYWWALIVVMVFGVLAAELMNTALEHALDGLHPEQAKFVQVAKDCAAGAVAMLSFGAVVVFVLMLRDSHFFG